MLLLCLLRVLFQLYKSWKRRQVKLRGARVHTHSYTKNIASDLLVVGFGFVCFFRFMVAGIEIFDSSSTCNCFVLRNK